MTTRHADIAEMCKPLLFWRDLHAGEGSWLKAENDNGPSHPTNSDDVHEEREPPLAECKIDIRPSMLQLFRAATDGVEFEPEGFRKDGRKVPRPGSPNVEYGNEYPASKPLTGMVRPMIRMGAVRFWTGDFHDTGLYRGQVISCGGYPVIDKWGVPKESGYVPANDNEAVAGPENDAEERFIRADLRAKLRERLSAADITALDAALDAKNFAEVGNALGCAGKTAERRGKRAVLTAAKNLSAILQKIAA